MGRESEPLIVAIDGPSGVGKTTVAREVARRLGIPYLETGAMYRALGWEVLRRGVDPEDRAAVESVAADLELTVELSPEGNFEVLVAGEALGERLRGPRVSEATSKVSVYPGVREIMVGLQRRCGREFGAAMEGRDIGTQVFPETPYKFFLEAPEQVRIERRLRQLRDRGLAGVSREEVVDEIAERDRRDTGREASPLSKDASYTGLDTGRLSADEVVEAIVARVRSLRPGS